MAARPRSPGAARTGRLGSAIYNPTTGMTCRWTASSVGDRFTSIWHRNPAGRWTFYESTACEVACTRYFGADVERVREGPIELEWEASNRLRVGRSHHLSAVLGRQRVFRPPEESGNRFPIFDVHQHADHVVLFELSRACYEDKSLSSLGAQENATERQAGLLYGHTDER